MFGCIYFSLHKAKIDGKTRKINYSLCQVYICWYILFNLSFGEDIKTFLTNLILSSNFAYSAPLKPGPSAEYIGIKISVLAPTQLVFTVLELPILQ